MELYLKKEDFVYEVEKLLENIEVVYSSYLFPFNNDTLDIDNYILTLYHLGIIMKKTSYTNSEIYINN